MAKTLRNDKINKIIYISLGGVVVAIILFIVLFNIFSNKGNNMQIGENNQKDILPASLSTQKQVLGFVRFEVRIVSTDKGVRRFFHSVSFDPAGRRSEQAESRTFRSKHSVSRDKDTV